MAMRRQHKCVGQHTQRFVEGACIGTLLLLGGAAAAQQTVPGLHARPPQAQNEPAAPPTVATGQTDLPPEAEGEYPWKSWRGDGQIEIYFEDGKLQGYMEEPQSSGNQTGAPLTFDFTETHIDGPALTFTTRTLHGTWYSFEGHLERGLAPSPAQSGYYRLTGTLTEHGSGTSAMQHTVSLPREPGSN